VRAGWSLAAGATLAAILAPAAWAGPPATASTETPIAEAERLSNEADALDNAGHTLEAIARAERALELREAALGPADPLVARSVNSLGMLYDERGDYARAETLFGRALSIRERALGPDHPDVAGSLNNLAFLYDELGEYHRAEGLLERALGIKTKALGAEHPRVATSLANLAGVYEDEGDYARAEPLYARALAIREKAFGPEHTDVATSLDNLAVNSQRRGDYTRAEPLYLRALAIREKALGPDHLDVSVSLNNLAALYDDEGRYEKAEPLYVRALGITEKKRPADHPEHATSLSNLALLYAEEGKTSLGLPLLTQALAISDTALGPKHPESARMRTVLAMFYASLGDYPRATSVCTEALAALEGALGSSHPYVVATLDKLVRLHLLQGQATEALALTGRKADLEEALLRTVVDSESESRGLAYMALLSASTDQVLSLHLQQLPHDANATQLALTTVLRRKGRILDSVSRNQRLLRAQAMGEDRTKLEELRAQRQRLAAMTVRGPGAAGLAPYKAELAELASRVDQLEDDLAKRVSPFAARQWKHAVTVDEVRARLAPGEALVEFVRYAPPDPRAIFAVSASAPRMAAYVLSRDSPPASVELGPADPIETAIGAFRESLSDLNAQGTPSTPLEVVRRRARELDEVLMRPVRTLLGGARTLVIAPDAQVSLVPFDALVDERGRDLIENYSIHYVGSGRDLVPVTTAAAAIETGPLVFADVDYGQGSAMAGLGLSPWRALPATRAEAEAIAHVVSGTSVLTGKLASEEALKSVKSPRMLFLDTHGFFLSDAPAAASPTATRGSMSLGERAAFEIPNPLLRSGLALAHANEGAAPDGQDDGVLTGVEAAGLDLAATRLVVLSACETGLGQVRSGEGVFGLRRAFSVAGAQTLVMSLWSVNDVSTMQLMSGYTSRLMAGGGRAESLREAALEVRKDPKTQHPYYWAPFIASGDATSLGGQPVAPRFEQVAPGPRGCSCRVGRIQPEDTAELFLLAALSLACVLSLRRRNRGSSASGSSPRDDK
jgi:CHAT domain-containing protein/tetratricopeptide (TPR) repeat protein